MGREPGSSVIRFGIFEADLQACELRKRGIRIRLQAQPFQLLATLLEQPGQVVTRQELQVRLWADDTFVDFDRGVNKAISQIRQALGDVATTPRFIETLPRRGYRFIAPIERSRPGSQVTHPSQVRSSLLPPRGYAFVPNQFTVTADGTKLAFVAAGLGGREHLYVRDLATPGSQQLNGTEGARLPFWRPDGRSLGFFAEGKLKAIDIGGSSSRVLCDAAVPFGAAWHPEDVILFAGQVAGPLYRVAASGGTPVPATPVPGAHSSQLHCWPVFLPRSDRFLYFVNRTDPADALCNGIYAGSLSSTESRLISHDIDGNVQYALGHLLFAADGGLHAQPFDPDSLKFTDGRRPIVQQELEIWERVWFRSGFCVSESGMVIFQSRNDFGPELVWSSLSGRECGRMQQRSYWEPAISPEGRFVAVSSDEFHDGRWCICIHDLERGVTTRLTEGGHDWHPSWSPDGASVIYDSTEGHQSCTYEIPADGSRPPRLLLEPGSACAHKSRDGLVVFMRIEHGRPVVYLYVPTEGRRVLLGPGAEPQFSPDGSWVALTEPGGGGISLREVQNGGRRLRVSPGPAAQPRWSRDGRSLFYITPDKSLMTVGFDHQTDRPGPPRKCFDTRIVGAALLGFQYDVGPEGGIVINSLPGEMSPLTLLTTLY